MPITLTPLHAKGASLALPALQVVCELPALKWLFLAGNPLEHLPATLGLLPSLSALNVDDCPLISPSADVVVRGFAAIKEWLRSELNRLMPSISSQHITAGSLRSLLSDEIDLEKDAFASSSSEAESEASPEEGSQHGSHTPRREALSSAGDDGGGQSRETMGEEVRSGDNRAGGRVGASPTIIDLRTPDASTCVVCFEEQRTHALVPCGHWCLCGTCSISIMRRGMVCPVCRAPFELAMKVFS